MTLIPSGGGVFEVLVDGEHLIYSKKATGRHAEYEEIAAALIEVGGTTRG